MTLPTASLHSAYSWDCPECGTRNYADSVTLAPEQVSFLRAQLPENDLHVTFRASRENGEGLFCTAPKTVACRDCGAEYKTENSG